VRIGGPAVVGRKHTLGPARDRVETRVRHDPVEPGPERASSVEPRQSAPGAEQRIPAGVLGVVERAEHPVAATSRGPPAGPRRQGTAPAFTQPCRPPGAPYRQSAARLRVLHAALRLARVDDPRRLGVLPHPRAGPGPRRRRRRVRDGAGLMAPLRRGRRCRRNDGPGAPARSVGAAGAQGGPGGVAERRHSPGCGEIALWQPKA
jgi:hypothetical protein